MNPTVSAFPGSTMERLLRITGHLFFLFFLVLAVVFSYERVLFSDSAYQFFKIINYEQFNIESSRFPAVFTQLFTLIGVKLHVPLQWLIVCFSVSFVLVYYVVFLLSVYVFRNTAAGFTIVLVLCLSVRFSYFHVVTETHQALVYACLFFAWMMNQNTTGFLQSWTQVPNLLLGIFFICLAGYSHPVGYLALLFCVLYFMLEKNRFKNTLGYLMLVLVIALAVLKYITTPAGTYEGQFLGQINRFDEIFRNFSNLSSVQFFKDNFRGMYLLPFVLIGIVCVYYLLTGRFKKMVFIPLYFLGFLLVTLVVFNQGDSRVMMERAFMPLAFFAAIPFLNDFIVKDFKFKAAKLTVIVLLLVFSFKGIFKASRYFSDRVEYMEQLCSYMEEIKSHKMLIDWKNTVNDRVYIPWAYALETLLYSTAQDPGAGRTVFVYDKIEQLKAPLDNEHLFLCVHFDVEWEDSMLNPRYFSLPTERYFVKQDPFLIKKEKK